MTTDTAGSAPKEYFRLLPGAKLTWRVCGDEFAVFNSCSGKSHILNFVDAEALRCLEAGSSDFEGLLQKMAMALKPGDLKPELAQYLEKLLIQFQEAGLIESELP